MLHRRQGHTPTTLSGNEIAGNCQARPLVRPSTLLKRDRKFEYEDVVTGAALYVLYTLGVRDLESKVQRLDRHSLTRPE